MELKERLLALNNQIPCTACGRCCSNNCTGKEGNMCRSHPKRVGKRQASLKRGLNCNLTPVELTLSPFGVACPPVLAEVEKLVGQRPPTERLPNGVEVIEGFSLYSTRFKPTSNPFSQMLATEIPDPD